MILTVILEAFKTEKLIVREMGRRGSHWDMVNREYCNGLKMDFEMQKNGILAAPRETPMETMASLCHSEAWIKSESKRGNGQGHQRMHEKAWR
jgi:hypothetical protein